MAAEIESMMYTRTVPWHGLGVKVTEAPTSNDALILAGLDWEVRQQPLGFLEDVYQPVVKTIHDQQVEVPGHATIKPVPGWFANVRQSDSSVLGVVSKQYKIIQNHEAFAFTDELIGMGGGSVKYETAGSLANGKTVWMLAKMPEWSILGDIIEPYLAFTNSHDGKNSAKAFVTPIRVVCKNTLNLAINNSQRMWSMTHIGDISTKIEDARKSLELSHAYMKVLSDEAERLARIKLPDVWLDKFLEELFPINSDYSNLKVRMAEESRQLLRDIYNNRPDIANFRSTGWGLINAVTDMVGHRPFGPTTTVTTRTFERKFENIISGDKLVDKAYDLLVRAV